MSEQPLPEQLRAARRRRGLTQKALAQCAGVSRVTIARLEGGAPQDVRAGTVTRLCDALGLEMAAMPVGRQQELETLLARERERTRRVERRLAHAALAARLLTAPKPEAQARVARARAVVDRWERERLCSRHYISRWRKLLEGRVERVAEALLGTGAWSDALFQNTPWSFALPAPRS